MFPTVPYIRAEISKIRKLNPITCHVILVDVIQVFAILFEEKKEISVLSHGFSVQSKVRLGEIEDADTIVPSSTIEFLNIPLGLEHAIIEN